MKLVHVHSRALHTFSQGGDDAEDVLEDDEDEELLEQLGGSEDGDMDDDGAEDDDAEPEDDSRYRCERCSTCLPCACNFQHVFHARRFLLSPCAMLHAHSSTMCPKRMLY